MLFSSHSFLSLPSPLLLFKVKRSYHGPTTPQHGLAVSLYRSAAMRRVVPKQQHPAPRRLCQRSRLKSVNGFETSSLIFSAKTHSLSAESPVSKTETRYPWWHQMQSGHGQGFHFLYSLVLYGTHDGQMDRRKQQQCRRPGRMHGRGHACFGCSRS
jgi:hypothetical protein